MAIPLLSKLGVCVNTGLDYWTGLLDWITGLGILPQNLPIMLWFSHLVHHYKLFWHLTSFLLTSEAFGNNVECRIVGVSILLLVLFLTVLALSILFGIVCSTIFALRLSKQPERIKISRTVDKMGGVTRATGGLY